MSVLLDKQWKVIEKSSGKVICILTSVDFPEMFWIEATVTPDELFDKYQTQFTEFTDIDPDNDPDMEKWEEVFDKLFSQIEFEAIDHEHEIEEAILYIFPDKTAHFRAIWKD